jgi:hypothetical protein
VEERIHQDHEVLLTYHRPYASSPGAVQLVPSGVQPVMLPAQAAQPPVQAFSPATPAAPNLPSQPIPFGN